ncbi:MAG: hypothetical protein K0V04_15670 [Deltaproteobacteria bacterium]|nr:hypothetical protein [Deltaproteobacteria bacterium]
MSKWVWLLGAGAGAVVLASATRKDDGEGDADPLSPGGDEADDQDKPVEPPRPSGGGEGGDTPTPAPAWLPTPYEAYERGPYTIDLTGLSTGVRWRAFETTKRPALEVERDAAKLWVGVELDDEEARVAANAFVDALATLPVEPFPVPPKPMPMPPDGSDGGVGPMPPSPPHGFGGAAALPIATKAPEVQGHGLNVYDDCARIEVEDVVSWIAWAEPWVRERVATMSGKELAQGLLQATFPECTWDLAAIRVGNGRWLADRLAVVEAAYFEPARAGVAWVKASPWEPLPLERAVAELLNVRAPTVGPPEFAFLEYHVKLDQVGDQWPWRAWSRGKHLSGADLSGGPVESWEAAVVEVKAQVSASEG